MASNYKSNAMHKSVKIEQITLNTTMAFTVSPAHQCDEKNQTTEFSLLIKDRVKAFTNHLHKKLTGLRGSAYKLYLEVSPTGIMHMHGFIRVYNIQEWALHDVLLLKTIGTYEVKLMDTTDTWPTYCKKQKKIWNKKIQSLRYID